MVKQKARQKVKQEERQRTAMKSQLVFAYSNSTMDTVGQCVKSIQS